MDNMSKNKPSTSMTNVACESKSRSVVRLSMPMQETGWQSCVRSCIMPGLPTHLVQESNDGTVSYDILIFCFVTRTTFSTDVED